MHYIVKVCNNNVHLNNQMSKDVRAETTLMVLTSICRIVVHTSHVDCTLHIQNHGHVTIQYIMINCYQYVATSYTLCI